MRYPAVATTLLALAFPISLFIPCTATAQGSPTPEDSTHALPRRGDRVRVSLGDSATILGHIVRTDSSQVVIAPDDSSALPRAIPLVQILQLEVERGAKARTVSTAVGGLIGIAAAASYYYFDWCRSDERACSQEERRAERAAYYGETYYDTGSVFAIAGLLAGGLLGYALAPAPHWEVVAAPIVERGPHGDPHAALRIGITRHLLGR